MLASVVTNMYAMRVRHRWQHPRFRNASNSLTAKSLLGFLSENLAICGKSLSVFDFGKICMLLGKKGMRVTDCCSHETCCTFWLRKFFNGQSEHIKIWTRKSPIMQLHVRVDCNLWLYRPECGIVCMLFVFHKPLKTAWIFSEKDNYVHINFHKFRLMWPATFFYWVGKAEEGERKNKKDTGPLLISWGDSLHQLKKHNVMVFTYLSQHD